MCHLAPRGCGVRGRSREVLRIELGPQPRFHEQQHPEPDGAARLGLCFQRRRHRDSDRMGAFVSRKPAAGGAESRRACFAMALRRTFLLWNTFLGSFEWPQMYLLYHTNDPPARTYCTRAFGRVAHTFITDIGAGSCDTSRLLARGARAAEVLRVEGAGCSSCETSGVWRGAVRTFELFPRYFKYQKRERHTRGRAGHVAVNSQRHWERGLQYCRFRALLAPRCRPAGLKCAV